MESVDFCSRHMRLPFEHMITRLPSERRFLDLEIRVGEVQEEYARLQSQVATRQQDIEYRIEAERRNFEVRIKKLQAEFEHASSTAMGY